ncbi:MAG: hypothetical protein K6T64_02270 [Kyrpidia sp.]|nr:hypothetical protein [Kyrpidia sp.]
MTMMGLGALAAYVTMRQGQIKGKKAFQKIFYFLTSSGIPTGLTFRIYHYGPYSSALDYEMDNIHMQGAITMEQEQNGRFLAWTIQPGPQAQDMIAEDQIVKEYKSKIDDLLSILPDDPKTLELWSTTHFVIVSKKRYGKNADPESVIKTVQEIKGDKFSLDEIRNAYDELMDHQLI